ncbi:MAG: 5-oxoprolinase subunit B family protein [Sciscionella sp.]
MLVRRCGESAVLVEFDHLELVLGLLRELRAQPPRGVRGLVPAARTLLVEFDPARVSFDALVAELTTRPLAATDSDTGEQVVLPVRYDGEDLADVAARTGMDTREVVRRHTAAVYTVAFCGFAPGFGYLTGLDAALRLPRHDTPRTRVPSGSVGLAGEYTGVYPQASPGGWRIIGHTSATVWDTEADPPALLVPGATVRFVEAAS